MSDASLRDALDRLLAQDGVPHVERLALAAAIVSEALRARGLEATLVGGGAIEFYAPGSYATTDIDLVVERARQLDNLEHASAEQHAHPRSPPARAGPAEALLVRGVIDDHRANDG